MYLKPASRSVAKNHGTVSQCWMIYGSVTDSPKMNVHNYTQHELN